MTKLPYPTYFIILGGLYFATLGGPFLATLLISTISEGYAMGQSGPVRPGNKTASEGMLSTASEGYVCMWWASQGVGLLVL